MYQIIILTISHVVADYMLQWDELAVRKTREYGFMFYHNGIVTTVSVLFGIVLGSFWAGLTLGVIHFIIDIVPVVLRKHGKSTPEFKYSFFLDQLLHIISVITVALLFLGKDSIGDSRSAVVVLMLVVSTFPAWAIVEWMLSADEPSFPNAPSKVLSSAERVLVVLGVVNLNVWILIVPFVARACFKTSKRTGEKFWLETAISFGIAAFLGLAAYLYL